MSRWIKLTSIAGLVACSYLTVLMVFAGIAAACSGGGGGGGGCTAPSVSTGSATSIGSNSVTLNGSVNPQGCYTEYAFEYGRSSEGYPNEIIGSAGSGTSSVSVSTSSAIVQPSTSYHFRLSAWNSGGEVTGGSSSFTTSGGTEGETCTKPTVTTEPASFISETSAQLNGSLNTNGCSTTYTFEWGPSSSPTSYPNKFSETVSNRGFPFAVLKGIYGLQPSTSYHFRLSAKNLKGTTEGADKTFVTEGKDPILFVHGWHGDAGSFSTMAGRFAASGWPQYWLKTWTYTDSEQSNVAIAQLVASKVTELLQATGKSKVDIITHSMGGLSGRYYLKSLGGTSKVEDFVSLGGPNHGTTVAEIGPNFCVSWACVEMRPGSTFLTNLNSGDETPGSVRYMTARSLCDPFIDPDDSVILSGAAKNLAWTPATACINSHFDLHEDSYVFSVVADFVD
jgi:triacylglycerol lipase